MNFSLRIFLTFFLPERKVLIFIEYQIINDNFHLKYGIKMVNQQKFKKSEIPVNDGCVTP